MNVISKKSLIALLSVLVVALSSSIFFSCTDDDPEGPAQITVSMTFKGPLFKGNYYSGFLPKTDWAIYVKDAANKYIKTLKINTGVVKIGQHGSHAKHLPVWLALTGDSITDQPDEDSIPPRFDGYTAASYSFNASSTGEAVTATWDFTDVTGAKVPAGTYTFIAEAANIQKDSSTVAPFFTLSFFSETSMGTVTYPEGAVVNGTATTNILSLTGAVE